MDSQKYYIQYHYVSSYHFANTLADFVLRTSSKIQKMCRVN